MTPDQLKELERLNERWANPDNFKNDTAISHAVMDLLPDVLTHIKQLESGIHELEFGKYGRSQLTAERDAALKKCAEIKALANAIHDYKSTGYTGIDIDLALEVINSTGCGKGYVPKAELDAANAKVADLQLIIDGLNVGYHADDEWGMVVEALRQVDQCGMEHFRFSSCACAGGVKQALAHAEKLTSQ